MRSSRPSSPPLTKPSPAGSPTSASTAPLCTGPPCTGEAASGAAAAISAGSRRTLPSPSAKATVAPSRLKAQAAAGASAAIERAGGRVCRHAGFARSGFTRLLEAVFEAALQVVAVEIAADEDELAGTLLA